LGAALVRAFTISAAKGTGGGDVSSLFEEGGVDCGREAEGGSVPFGSLEAIAGFGAGVSEGSFEGLAAGVGVAATGMDAGGGSPDLIGSNFLDSPDFGDSAGFGCC
jgi:hypothetical protein